MSRPAPVRILHCDDSEGVRTLVSALLAPYPALHVVEQVDSHADVMERAAVLQPDLVLLDLDAGRDEQVVARLRETCSARIHVLSGEADLEADRLAAQADGFVSKSAGASAIARSVLAAAGVG